MSKLTELREQSLEYGERALRSRTPVGAVARFLGSWASRFLAVQGFDRAVAIGAQAFTAIFPLLVVVAAVRGHGDASLGDEVVELMGLNGPAADVTRQAFAPIGDTSATQQSTGTVLLLAAILSLSRAVQRLYERALGLRPLGLRSTGYGLLWMLVMVGGALVGEYLYHRSDGVVRIASALSVATVVALLTPYLLLMRRLTWRRLVSAAVMTAVGVYVFAWLSSIWMSRSIDEWASRFGIIGVAFALLSWMAGAGFLLVLAACGGAVLDEQREDPDLVADHLLEELRHGQSGVRLLRDAGGSGHRPR